jgi:hypothetical protein
MVLYNCVNRFRFPQVAISQIQKITKPFTKEKYVAGIGEAKNTVFVSQSAGFFFIHKTGPKNFT